MSACLALWCTFVFLPAPARGAAQETEFLLNPGFERVSDPDSLPDGWGCESNGMVTVMADAETSHRGSYYLKIDTTGGRAPCRIDAYCRADLGQNQSSRAPVEPGQKYAISFWAKGKGKVRIGVFEYDNRRWLAPTINLEEIVVHGETWQAYELIYTPTATGRLPDRNGAAVGLANFGVWVEGLVCLDDFSFRQAAVK